MQIVAVDIGGTHARFALATLTRDGRIALDEPETLRTQDHASFQSAWQAFRARRGGNLPEALAMAIAGPVPEADLPDSAIRFTNNPWIIRPASFGAALGIDRSTIVNDFAAVAHAVARAEPAHLFHLTGPEQSLASDGTISVVGPGTGLGVAHFHRGGGSYRVQAAEGGHIDFAPVDAVEDAILARLRERHGRVSVERVVSGPGIVEIHQTLAALDGRTIAEEEDVDLWTRGLDGSDALAAAAVDRFCLMLGSVAGDIALVQGGFGGVVIAGGLGLRLKQTLRASGFAKRFCAKGRFAGLMASIPVKLITHQQPGLFGAAAAFQAEHSESCP